MTYDIEDVAFPAPTTKPEPNKRRGKKPKVRDALRNAAKEYKQAYLAVYGVRIELTYDGTWIRIPGVAQGVSLTRLKELTRQLENRRG